jgi:hypothetical protein
MPDFGALRRGSQVDVLTAMNDRDPTFLCGCLVAHAGTAVGRLVVEVRADRLCRVAAWLYAGR